MITERVKLAAPGQVFRQELGKPFPESGETRFHAQSRRVRGSSFRSGAVEFIPANHDQQQSLQSTWLDQRYRPLLIRKPNAGLQPTVDSILLRGGRQLLAPRQRPPPRSRPVHHFKLVPQTVK